MKAEIERIVECDEAGRLLLSKAQQESKEIIKKAEEQLANAKASISEELDRFKKEEIAEILEGAEKQAEKIREDAQAYCSDLRKRFREKETEIHEGIQDLIRNLIRT